jgi:nicotinamidase-related amidase
MIDATGGSVLLALHYQNDVIHPQGKIGVGLSKDGGRHAALVASARRLLAGAREFGVPVISVRIAFRPDHADVVQNCRIFRDVATLGAVAEGSWGAEFHEGLEPKAGEFVVDHKRVNAFFGSALEPILYRFGARKIAIAGVATHSTVEHTARHAADIGFEVTVVEDACSAAAPETHAAALASIGLIGEIATVDAMLAQWKASRP